jgi:hypothetical protein
MRARGFRVESVFRVLTEHGVPVAPRTYRNWNSAAPSARTVTDAALADALRATVGTPEWFAEPLVLEGIAASIGSTGDAYENALAEMPETKRTSSIEPRRKPTWWRSALPRAEPRASTQFGLKRQRHRLRGFQVRRWRHLNCEAGIKPGTAHSVTQLPTWGVHGLFRQSSASYR